MTDLYGQINLEGSEELLQLKGQKEEIKEDVLWIDKSLQSDGQKHDGCGHAPCTRVCLTALLLSDSVIL